MPEIQHWSIGNLDMTPPGYWRFLVKETGKWFDKYLSLSDLISDLRKHYTANGLPVPTMLEQMVIDQLCPDLPIGWCQYSGHDLPENGLRGSLTFSDALAGTKTLLSWQWEGRPKVTLAEATERAAICTRCQYNVHPAGCPSCNSGLAMIVKAFVGKLTTPHDANLRACKVCGCSLRSKIQFPLEILRKNMDPRRQALFPKWCWLALNKDSTPE